MTAAVLVALADRLAEAALALEASDNVYDQRWAAHLRRDATSLRLLAQADRHQRPAEVAGRP